MTNPEEKVRYKGRSVTRAAAEHAKFLNLKEKAKRRRQIYPQVRKTQEILRAVPAQKTTQAELLGVSGGYGAKAQGTGRRH